jgi:N-acetylmuramoyl-L-alanine amidase
LRLRPSFFAVALASVVIAIAACSSTPSDRSPAVGSETPARQTTTTSATTATGQHLTTSPSPVTPSSDSTTGSTTNSTTIPRSRLPLAGLTIALDPGHTEAPIPSHDVNIGNGIRHPCDSTGTANRKGLSESSLVLDVALHVRDRLQQLGARVQMTRTTNDQPAPCIDERVEMANRVHADIGLAIHADGVSGRRDAHGFHINVPTLIPGQTSAVVTASLRLALALRAEYELATGMPTANYLGTDGMLPRGDLANTNLTNHPRVLFELGVLNNATPGGRDDLDVLGSAAGRAAIETGLTNGIVRFVRAGR